MKKCIIIIVAAITLLSSGVYFIANHSSEILMEFTEEELEAVVIERVVDGDTIDVKNAAGEHLRIRMIGVNTPESVSLKESENSSEGEVASKFTKEQLPEGMTVYLEYDKDRTDLYSRTLAYVWLSNTCNRNDYDDFCKYNYGAVLLQETFCEASYYAPNEKYREWYEKLDGTQ